ncbi:ATP-binding cassette domain-containing protein [Thermosulfuriphilus ammonigenes]|uniref:ATP-binding cassette domain-containing protein n=1 Tax=Thermosulfuriphilus ammonigenes TaxID=1936021 RepID=A0A6G7PVC7_9BACT|nr:ATP-binding cassette domain-containing protein [Thermosulfuriphilus ammonigenes]MBA2848192.1 ABC-type sugar transport system ATPase subunit [Thermosulfuriphilus ammonigenes]QIJ71635.1 ATP-binding cassette domain-containing protein [Thermosulfuriphilus ammonigenes]
MVRARLKKNLGDFQLEVDIRLDPMTYHVMLGPSGSGKSLTLRLLAGFVTPDKGTVESPKENRIVYLPQNLGLFPHLSVYENLTFSYLARGQRPPQSFLDELIRTLGLNGLLDRLPRDLSGGQAQRVALGRALMAGPRVLLLDEPLSSLDFHLRLELIRLLKELKERFQLTILHVTHDPIEAHLLAEKIFVIEEGRLIYQGDWGGFLRCRKMSPFVSLVAAFFRELDLIQD